MENLITLTIRSTHYYLLDTGKGKLMVDNGWAGSLPTLQSQLKRYGVSLAEIRFIMITHHHPDHAGLTQELKHAAKARLLILEQQVPYLENLAAFYASSSQFQPVRIEPGDIVLPPSNRTALQALGIRGQIVATPGHSDDSVSFVLDSGLAFIGDLHPPDLVRDEARELTSQSWNTLLNLGVKTIYPAHGDPFSSRSLKDRNL